YLREAIADPGRVVQLERCGEVPRADLVDDRLQDLAAHRVDVAACRIRGQDVDLRGDELIRSNTGLAHAKALAAASKDMEETELRHVPLRDRGEATHRLRQSGCAHFTTLPDQADAERNLVAQARLRHLDIALLENLEREHALREQNRAQ